jgi:ABC-type multidrug transport system fused ATPase/permease subunit
MFKRFGLSPDTYYEFCLRVANLKQKAKILPVNFQGHWTAILFSQKRLLIIALLCEAVIQVFYTLYPLFIGFILARGQYSYFFYLILTWLCVIIVEFIGQYYSALLEIQCINSIQFNAFQFFLTVDPLYHTMKASGKLFAKIERAARAYEDFIDIALWDILPVIVSVSAVIISLFITDPLMAVVALCMLLLNALINITTSLFTSATFEQRVIDADDAVKTLSVESLTQVQLIRSSFATQEITAEAKLRSKEIMYTEGTAWLAFIAAITISRLTYLLSIFVLGMIILSSISRGALSILGATTLLLTYINGTYEIIQIGRRLRKIIRASTRISDLYTFIGEFGKQTFPVLPVKEAVPEQKQANPIILEAKDLRFDYNPKAKIFDDHHLYLKIPIHQENKLYGIIGPSGVGKTTLLSLLGGQLKPDSGSITINGVPIYEVDDLVRRSLIATQGQIASSLSGTVRSNLLLGIPATQTIYSDSAIISILKKVGIWPVFEEKEGLHTPIGESGLTLSGGQRQRLNFASLYLRAHYYKPVLILIDEPTSSLDEVSELAITAMIRELATNALTIVIAHRLKTLNDAVGIVDFSLLDGEKDIVFHTRPELEQKSSYYRKLMQGDISIEG